MSTLFISHSSADAEAAKVLQARLEAQGHRSVFLDFDPDAGIQAGASWERTLYTKLRACRAVVALCSETYLKSQWCFAEIALARMEGKEVFALKIDPWSDEVDLPSILHADQFIDLRTDPEDGYKRLWNGFDVKGIVAAEQRLWRPDDPPYPGLRTFKEADASVFFGRDAELLEGMELLNQIVRQGYPKLAMVLGSSGSGKSSLVRAGLLPLLRKDPRHWTVVRTFRPRAEPLRELSVVLSDAFTDAQMPVTWEDIYKRLRADEPTYPDPIGATIGQEPTIATARDKLRQALDAMESALGAQGGNVPEPVQKLRVYLEDDGDTDADALPTEVNALVAIGHQLRIAARAPDAPIILVIDQFEELLGHDARHPASHFLTMLRTALDCDNSPFLVIGTMRSDFLSLLQAAQPLQGLGRKSISVGPMAKEGMRQIIEQPALLGQLELEDGLADLLLEDTQTADALPLLAFTLRTMWDRFRDDRLLEIREYHELGGLQGAIALVAEETYQTALDRQPDPAARTAAARKIRDAFLSMARPTTESVGWARNSIQWDHLDPDVQPMLEPFVDPQRLLVRRAAGTVEVAHEALFRSWGRLRRWLEENAEALHLLNEIQIEAEKWAAAQPNDKAEYLWAGGRLARARELRDYGVLSLSDLDHKFIDASGTAETAAADAVEAQRQRELRRTKQFAGVVGAAFIGAVGLGLLAVNERNKAAQEAAVAQAKTAVNLLGTSPVNGLLNAIEAADPNRVSSFFSNEMHPEIQRSLVASLQLSNAGRIERNRLDGHKSWVGAVGFHPDGDRIVSADDKGSLRFWSADGTSLGAPWSGHLDMVQELSVHPAGAFVVTVGPDGLQRTAWDGTPIRPALPQSDQIDSNTQFDSVAISPDGRYIVAGADTGCVLIWDMQTPQRQPIGLDAWQSTYTDAPIIESLAFHPSGAFFASGDDYGTITIWTLDGRRADAYNAHHAIINDIEFTPDGEYLISASADQTLASWLFEATQEDAYEVENCTLPDDDWVQEAADDATQFEVESDANDIGFAPMRNPERLFLGHDNEILSLAISPHGNLIASSGEDRTVRLWNLHGKPISRPLVGHAGPIFDVAFSPDGTTLASASSDLSVRLWDLPPAITAYENGIYHVAVSPDGQNIATVDDLLQVRLWDAGLNPVEAEWAETAPMDGRIEYLQDGTTLFSYSAKSDDGTLQTVSPGVFEKVGAHGAPGIGLAVSKTDDLVATASFDGMVRLWNGKGELLDNWAVPEDELETTAISADGTRGHMVAAAGASGQVHVFSLDTGDLQTLDAHSEGIYSLDFSADGRFLLSAGRDRKILLHDLNSEAPAVLLDGHVDVVTRARFFANDQYIVSGSEDNTLRIWDLDGKNIGIPMLEHTDWITWLDTDDAKQRIFTASKDGTLRSWDMSYLDHDPHRLLTETCDLLMRHSISSTDAGQKPRAICEAHLQSAPPKEP
ncbi:MAG: toll/interleukin-1 receptor domain-containing protein [Roseobacter sp.]